jgi:NAD(P)-dependent dehydrogenase (short-subunit alcohol dehydrogenase family)
MQLRSLAGRVALVAGATRGASRAVAVELARAGAFVYATGRSSRTAGPSELGRPETIEQTGELIDAVGEGAALRVDHLEPAEVEELVAGIERRHGRLDVLVNGIFGGDAYVQFGKTLWEHDLSGGLRMLRMGIDTHAITGHFALPLLIRRTGGLVLELTDTGYR